MLKIAHFWRHIVLGIYVQKCVHTKYVKQGYFELLLLLYMLFVKKMHLQDNVIIVPRLVWNMYLPVYQYYSRLNWKKVAVVYWLTYDVLHVLHFLPHYWPKYFLVEIPAIWSRDINIIFIPWILPLVDRNFWSHIYY